MASELLVVQVVQFFASCQSLADSSLFHTVRDIVQCWQWQGKGLKAQYWGTSIKQANDFYWLLFWPSRDHVAAFKADPSYPAFLQKRQSLATAPVYDVLVQFSGSPKRCLEAPISEVDLYKTHDLHVRETQNKIRRLTHRIESLQMKGFIALSWGVVLEDITKGVYLGGWRTIEEHMQLGTIDAHKVFVKECEEIFENLAELTVVHVQFKPHIA